MILGSKGSRERFYNIGITENQMKIYGKERGREGGRTCNIEFKF